MSHMRSVCACALFVASGWTAQAQDKAKPQPASQAVKAAASKSAGRDQAKPGDDDGDVIWQQQCSRCHNAPTGFSPRIAGTVIRHMRVRASLSQREEQELLSFLNP